MTSSRWDGLARQMGYATADPLVEDLRIAWGHGRTAKALGRPCRIAAVLTGAFRQAWIDGWNGKAAPSIADQLPPKRRRGRPRKDRAEKPDLFHTRATAARSTKIR